METRSPDASTPPTSTRRRASQYFTPPSASPAASGSNRVSSAVDYFESRSEPPSPRSAPRPVVSRRPSAASGIGEEKEGQEVLDKAGGGAGGSGGKRRGNDSREGSPTPVKGVAGRRTAISGETTPTRPAPRASLSGSRIPIASSSGSATRLAPRATPPLSAGSPGSVPHPRSVSQGQAGPSRLPRPVRRVSAATSATASTSSSRSQTPAAPYPGSKIPVLSPRRRPLRPSDSIESIRTSSSEAAPREAGIPEDPDPQPGTTVPRVPRTPPPGSRRTSYILSNSSPSHTSSSPPPSLGRGRRPSSGSIGSPGRRPSGPRPQSHTPQTSITSISSLLSDGSGKKGADNRRLSRSGRSSSQSVTEVDQESISVRPHDAAHPLSTSTAPETDPTTPIRPLRVDTAPRTSSIAPDERALLTARPPISPRLSSRENLITIGSVQEIIAPPGRPPIDAKRRASTAVHLGEVSPTSAKVQVMPPSAPPDHSDFMPSPTTSQRPSRVGRRGSQIPPDSDYAAPPAAIPDFSERGATLPRQSPKPERNRQGLVVDTSAIAIPRRQSSSGNSPPIPARNPMRQLASRPESAASSRRMASGSTKGDSPITRTPSLFLDSPAEEAEEGVSPGGRSSGRLPLSAGNKDDRYSSGTRRSQAGSTDSRRTREDGSRSAHGEGEWSTKRRGRIMAPGEMEAMIQAADWEVEQKTSLEIASASSGKAAPEVATERQITPPIPTTTTTFSTPLLAPSKAPLTPEPIRHTPTKSPSMPLLGHGSPPSKASRLLGLSPSAQPHLRSGTDPMAAQNRLLPPPMLRSPTTPNISASAQAKAPEPPVSAGLSKRSHLIREIAMTERAYATDLALLRDAFMVISQQQRRPSVHSMADSMNGGLSPGWEIIKNSMPASQSMDSRPISGYSLQSTQANVPPPASPLPRSPSASAEIGGMSSYFASSTSLSPLPHFSPRTSVIGANMASPIGKPLSPADIRAIFLNIDQLASASEDLAVEFARAIGEEEAGPGVTGREGEGGTDKLGEVFMTNLPRIRPLYNFYCARQSTASVRLVEVQADPSHSTYLKDRWEQIRPHTHAWNLDSMLIKPVQRITKYPLLFDDLLACTTPVHPDYFSIRSAAEQCRAMALEIDEAKRRKDLVAGVISKKPVSSGPGALGGGSGAKTPKKSGLKLFRKDKGGASTISLANTLANPSTASLATASTATLVPSPTDLLGGTIPQVSFTEYRLLVERLEDAERMVRRTGREVVQYTAAAKEVFVAQLILVASWERVVKLDGTDPGDKRLRAFRKVGEALIDGCWVELNAEVRNQVMPALSRLLDCSENPRKVILKRDGKAADYARITQQKDRLRTPDRGTLDSAREFVALHTQLVEELPTFLEGYIRIFDLAVLAFSRAQARYHSTVRDKVDAYLRTCIASPATGKAQSPKSAVRSPTLSSDSHTIDLNDDDGETALEPTAASSIVQTWQAAWTPYADAMDHFRITRSATKSMADRMASYSERTGGRGHVRTGSNRSGNASPTGSISASASRPDLRHANSFSSAQRPAPNGAKLVSPASSVRRMGAGSTDTATRSRSASLLMPAPASFSVTRSGASNPASTDQSDAISVDRRSFGLPKISPSEEKTFSGIGLTPRSQASGMMPDPPAVADLEGLGIERVRSGSSSQVQGQVAVVPPTPPTRSGASTAMGKREGVLEDDAGEGWRNERVLYQCGVVADFDPTEVGSRRYRKLRFLPVATGDLIDVFYEVGRIDELPAFPYPEIGVENDGLLVGRKEDGDIGLVICSFLEPIT